MENAPFSRRNFLTALATTAVAVTLPDTAAAFVPDVSAGNDIMKRNRAAGPIKVLCTHNFSSREVQRIQEAGKNVHLILIKDPGELKAHLADAEVILGSIDGNLVPSAKGLKWVQTMAAGVENMPAELKEHPCTLTNMQRVYAPVIAETAIAMLLSLTRGLAQVSVPALAQRKWVQATGNTPLVDLYGKTIGIVGMGGIGSETARRLHYGFNMQVLATDAKALPKPDFVARLHDPTWFMEMVPQVDVLMSAAPLTKETKGMFNAAVFNRMKPGAYFINVSRGGLVDQDALVKALKEKKIQGAGLDVTTPEPLPHDDPLWTCPNVVITPHNSGQAPVRQERAIALIAENVRRYSNNLPLMNVVDKQKGY
jgi:phosphoglycerate dehydrogenase-like enzyme